MRAQSLLDQRRKALEKTRRQLVAVENANEEGKYNNVIRTLKTKEARQAAAVVEAEAQLQLFTELDIDIG